METNNKGKQTNQKINIENVFILGAGASKAEGAPLQGALFKEFIERCGGTPAEERLKTKIEKFFAEYFHVENEVYPTFEEVLGIIEIALRKDEVFKPDPSIEYLQDIRQSLIMMIAVTLDNTLKDSRYYHKDLINTLKKRGEILNTCFIDMNYDILIDNAIIPLHGGNPQYDLDYGIEFTNFNYPDSATNNGLYEKWHRPNPDMAIKLFKLHGSLNWLYCPTCIAVTLTPKEKGVCKLLHEKEKCKCLRCGSSTIPVIIPPTYFKVMSNYYLQQIWLQAEEILRGAKKIYFCGYSFPDADIHVKYLLKRAEMFKNDAFEITIINDHKEKTKEQKEEEENRFRRFFGSRHIIKYISKTFETFVDELKHEMNE